MNGNELPLVETIVGWTWLAVKLNKGILSFQTLIGEIQMCDTLIWSAFLPPPWGRMSGNVTPRQTTI